jgi:predicted nucleic acid-binding protein
MIYSSSFTALLDANILYPAPLRDFLLRLAAANLHKPKWTDRIQEEWIRNLLLNRQDLKRETLERTKDAMNTAFPDANVTQYESLVDGLSLPDPDDRHVLAAAIRGQADVIVTFNLKDFPPGALAAYDIEVRDPDTFVAHLIELDRPKVLEAILNLVKSLKNPQKTIEEVLQTLENQGLPKSVDMIKKC